MKVLTNNIKLFFECCNDICLDRKKEESGPNELCLSGVPICPTCEDEMELEDECIIKN
jgi:hypothetical protein